MTIRVTIKNEDEQSPHVLHVGVNEHDAPDDDGTRVESHSLKNGESVTVTVWGWHRTVFVAEESVAD